MSKPLKTRTLPNGLTITNRLYAVIFSVENKDINTNMYHFEFTQEEFTEFANYMKQIAERSWKEIHPDIAGTEAAEYYEYFDKEYDAVGKLTIDPVNNTLIASAPYQSPDRLYQFNKNKMKSFLFDLQYYIVDRK